MVTSIKLTFFMLVTTRPIAHSRQFVCIQNCVGEFGTDTGQSLVTSNMMSNHLSDHHKAYYTYIHMYIKKVYYYVPYGHLTEFSSATKPIIFAIQRTVLVPGVCPCIRIRSTMYYVHTGEAAVTSIKLTFFCLSSQGL